MTYVPWDSFESEYLVFEDTEYIGKTKRIRAISKGKWIVLGEIRWWSPWRQYVLFPASGSIWNDGCLEDIKHVIKALMDERKKR